MLNMISGTVSGFEGGMVTIDTGLLGFGVTVPSTTQCIIGRKIKLFVHMHGNAE